MFRRFSLNRPFPHEIEDFCTTADGLFMPPASDLRRNSLDRLSPYLLPGQTFLHTHSLRPWAWGAASGIVTARHKTYPVFESPHLIPETVLPLVVIHSRSASSNRYFPTICFWAQCRKCFDFKNKCVILMFNKNIIYPLIIPRIPYFVFTLVQW